MTEWFTAAMGSPQASADGKYGTVNTNSVGMLDVVSVQW